MDLEILEPKLFQFTDKLQTQQVIDEEEFNTLCLLLKEIKTSATVDATLLSKVDKACHVIGLEISEEIEKFKKLGDEKSVENLEKKLDILDELANELFL